MVSRRASRRGHLGGLIFLILLSGHALGVDVSELENPEDPWEGFNRKIYAFNDGFDRYLLLPVAKGYNFVMPEAMNQGVSNFFSNLSLPITVINDVLQLKPRAAVMDTGRFLFNLTVGVFGFIDVATMAGMPDQREDFGQTMGYWGVKSGPYVVLPFLGGQTVRDAFGLVPNYWISVQSHIDDVAVRNSLIGLQLIDGRADLIPAEQLITGDRYIFLRDAYLQQRKYQIADGEIEDDFGEEIFEEFDEFEDFDDESNVIPDE